MKLLLLIILLTACTKTDEATIKSEGAASMKHTWFKTPTEIKNTVENTFNITISDREKGDYFSTLGSLYGEFSEGEMQYTLNKPDGAYLLGLDIVSTWLSKRLLLEHLIRQLQMMVNSSESEKGHRSRTPDIKIDTPSLPAPSVVEQKDETAYDEKRNFYLFGSVVAGEVANPYAQSFSDITSKEQCSACYADDSKDWCDCPDDVILGQFYQGKSMTYEDSKRIMHNIQDVGEFIGVPIDNMSASITVGGKTYPHTAFYLLHMVFIPALQAQQTSCAAYFPISPEEDPFADMDAEEDGNVDAGEDNGMAEEEQIFCSDFAAWQKVVHAMLMSGPFFVHLDTRKED